MSEPLREVPARSLLTLAQVAAFLQVSDRTVARLAARGELKPYRVGTALRFDPDELDAYLEYSRTRPSRRRTPSRLPGGRQRSSSPFVDRLGSSGP